MDPTALAASLEPCRHGRRWWIAYSGGVDSHVLLHLVVALARAGGCPPLTALHINHQLNPRAPAWAEHCRRVCRALGVELRVIPVEVDRAGGQGLEAAARAARYAAFARLLGEDEWLLQAHHADDQVETLLLRLLRGAGLAGFAAMPATRALGRGRLLRPFLRTPRPELLAYARSQGLSWIHDDSNDDPRFDRNFLRHRVVPAIAGRWPAYRDTLGRASGQAAEAEALLRDLAQLDLAAAGRGAVLDVTACRALSPARRRNLLRHWLRERDLPPPSRAQLDQALSQLGAVSDAEVCVSWPGAELRRFRNGLYALAPLPAVAATDTPWHPPQALSISGMGTLRAHPAVGQGLRADRDYRVRNRRGGERCKPSGRAHSQTLKKLLQEAGIPPWLRDRLPLLYCEDELAAVGDLWVCAGYESGAGLPGWKLEWSLLPE